MKNTSFITKAALIAATYVVLTYLVNLFGLASGAIQVRLSEMLAILPVFTTAAIPGVTIGCLLANILTGCCPLDIVMGSLATLIGVLGARALRKHKYLVPLPTIIANTVIVPFVLTSPYGYGMEGALWYIAFTVAIGEILSCGVLGMVLLNGLERYGSPVLDRIR